MLWIGGIVLGILCMSMDSCNSCKTEADCPKDECCAAMTAHNLHTGRCLKLGKEGSRCNMKEEKLLKHGGKYMRACPCHADYTCTAKHGMEELVIGDLAMFLLKCHKATHKEKENVLEYVFEKDGVIDEDKIIDMVEKKS